MKNRRSEDIERICKYCESASSLYSTDEMICKKKGIVPADSRCRKFSYDPLKRDPRKIKLDTEGLEFPNIND